MKKKYTILSIFCCLFFVNAQKKTATPSTNDNTGIVPSVAPESKSNQYSNNKILTTEDIVITEDIKPITGKEKVLSDAFIIYKNDGTVVSYDLESKKQKWEYKFTDGSKEKMRNGFNIENGILYVASSKKQLVALNVNDGSAYWKNDIGLEDITRRYATNGQFLPISKSLIFLPTFNKNLYAFNKTTGQHIWNYQMQFEFNQYSPAVTDAYLIVPNAPWVYCFETQTGKALWQRGFKDRPMYTLPKIDDERAYVADEIDMVYALNLKNNANIDWEFKLGEKESKIGETMILNNGILYFATSSGLSAKKKANVYALDSKSGKSLWKTEIEEFGKIKSLQQFENTIIGFAEGEKNFMFVVDSKNGKAKTVLQPKENAISNVVKYSQNSVAFLTRNYFMIYDFTKNTFEEQALNINDPEKSRFDVYMEIIRKK
ncbi:PQQ-binding-like beta-propeller repeat protein [Chryseobacterium sp. FH1]|uniref:PQQ-binding-like beta-propeller repeat protein n=1 Tax=Chryseobacterium sp. FH1 TaxID=1233951 RepID=UPI0004E31E61|nr:PQQ-binding-like beta-propeller repeat protein [Chryseobacterium sp. FH1]KFC20695.1 pyrrolo-quinoline quinone repeat-containing protein [Chryseobacterium sp. FH1]